jgi:HD-like signal output (HDOD) protein
MIQIEKEISLAEQTDHEESPLDRLLKHVRRTDDFPTISKYVIELNHKLSLNPNNSHAADLANVILKDHGLTSKLLKMVNSAFYGLAGGKVSTITRAVVVLGYENIRLAALSLMLFEHFKSKTNSKHLKEAVVGSFWTGTMARELAEMDGRIDPEEAFICAMMGHLGKLMMIYYLPDEYGRIRTLMADKRIREAKAAKSVCGVTFDQLGMAVVQLWNFPPNICDSLQILTTAELQRNKKSPPRLRVVSSFARQLGETIERSPSSLVKKRLQRLLERYQPHLNISKKQLESLIKRSLDNVYQHAQAVSLDVCQSVFIDRLSTICDSQKHLSKPVPPPELSEQTGESFHLIDENHLKAHTQITSIRNPKDIIMEGIQELSQIMITENDIDTIAVTSLEVFYRALDFQRALMFIRDKAGKTMSVRFGYGDNCRRMIGRLGFDTGPSEDLFNLSIRVGKDLIVADSYDQKMNQLIPGWYREKINAPSFVFLPIVLRKLCIGALYADRDTTGLPVSATEHTYLSLLRNQVVLSLKYMQ